MGARACVQKLESFLSAGVGAYAGVWCGVTVFTTLLSLERTMLYQSIAAPVAVTLQDLGVPAMLRMEKTVFRCDFVAAAASWSKLRMTSDGMSCGAVRGCRCCTSTSTTSCRILAGGRHDTSRTSSSTVLAKSRAQRAPSSCPRRWSRGTTPPDRRSFGTHSVACET